MGIMEQHIPKGVLPRRKEVALGTAGKLFENVISYTVS